MVLTMFARLGDYTVRLMPVPVSYTHLDVYKRQLKDSADLAIFRKAWVKRDVSATSAMFLRNCS